MPTVFVTGGSGFIGSAVIPELLQHGYGVVGLARSDASAEKLSRQGVIPLRGDLVDLEILKEGARQSDGVIHLAFIHEFGDHEAMNKATAVDREAIKAMSEGLEGSEKPLIICGGTLSYPKNQLATEDTKLAGVMDRDRSDELIKSLSKEKNIRGMSMILSPTVHGKGDKGFITILGQMAQANGFAAYIGDGSARWPAVHCLDAASLFRLAFEKGKAGAVYNGVAEQGNSMLEVQTAIGRKLNLPVESKTVEEISPTMGFFAIILGLDNPTSSEKTKRELGWEPKHIGLLEDIQENYFL